MSSTSASAGSGSSSLEVSSFLVLEPLVDFSAVVEVEPVAAFFFFCSCATW